MRRAPPIPRPQCAPLGWLQDRRGARTQHYGPRYARAGSAIARHTVQYRLPSDAASHVRTYPPLQPAHVSMLAHAACHRKPTFSLVAAADASKRCGLWRGKLAHGLETFAMRRAAFPAACPHGRIGETVSENRGSESGPRRYATNHCPCQDGPPSTRGGAASLAVSGHMHLRARSCGSARSHPAAAGPSAALNPISRSRYAASAHPFDATPHSVRGATYTLGNVVPWDHFVRLKAPPCMPPR